MASLIELCSICFTCPPKYTCPRCACQTCSLACVKTHKLRAACSGIRNPAAYLRSSELATPASIDRDYNFISRVQRDIERAEDDVAERGGVTLVPTRHALAGKGLSKLAIEYAAYGVTVVKAPTGLTRSKRNKTHWDKRHGCVMWTVEWVLQNDQKVLANVRGGRTVGDAFTNGVGKRGLQRKRKLGDEERGGEGGLRKQTAIRNEDVKLQSKAETPGEEQPPPDEPAEDKEVEEPLPRESETETPVEEHPPYEKAAEDKETAEVPPAKDPTQSPALTTTTSSLHFYLHHPRTSSKHVCLIPISPTSLISDILRERTILEYPTIYTRAESPDELTSPFISEENYEEQFGVDVVPVYGLHEEEEATGALGGIPEDIDERKVLEVLRKDVVG